METIRTSELIGTAFDWAVAVCEGHAVTVLTAAEEVERYKGTVGDEFDAQDEEVVEVLQSLPPRICVLSEAGYKRRPSHSEAPMVFAEGEAEFRYSTSLTQGGPIIEREGIAVRKHSSGTWYAMLSTDLGDCESAQWNKAKRGDRYGKLSYQVNRIQCRFEGPTMLIAALRCYVASKLGDEVQVPEELL